MITLAPSSFLCEAEKRGLLEYRMKVAEINRKMTNYREKNREKSKQNRNDDGSIAVMVLRGTAGIREIL